MTGSSVNLTSAVGLIVAVVFLALTVGVVAVFIIVVVANRAEPDATARRPLVVYLFGMSFFTLFAALIASSAVVSALVQLIGSHPRTPLSQVVPDLTVPLRDTVARNAVLGALIIVTGLGLLVVHLR